MPKLQMSAGQITSALAARHEKDTFVPECNLGAASRGCRRIDAWVLKSTWNPMTVVGYEIKVRRGDFMKDEKWVNYLPFVHEFYFACPWKLILPGELPEHVGRIWVDQGGRARIKRRAPRQQGDPEKMARAMAYILMWRSQIGPDQAHPSDVDWKRWLEKQERNSIVGHKVAHKIAQAVENEVGDIRRENQKLRYENERLQGIKDRLKELGLDEGDGTAGLNAYYQKLHGILPPHQIRKIQMMSGDLDRIAKVLQDLREQSLKD